MFELGSLRIHLVSDGVFRLDGGAMFGVIPKPMWERAKIPDERNRIGMGTNCLLIESSDGLVLVDSGAGDKHDTKFLDIYGMEPGPRLPDAIRASGFELEDVRHVVLTHLHFDHCGWNTRRTDSGALIPTFPNARYWIERGEVEHARRPSERDRASYFGDNWEPLFAAGVVELFDDEAEPVAGVRAVKTPGHNADMCMVLLDGGREAKGIFWADLIPTTAHVPLPWIMGFDLYPMQTLANKKKWLPVVASEGWLGIFEHDAESPLARIVSEKPGKFQAVPVAL
jgi:glyoxylase-like metal-dependent hydrolase (beta-lactamase superfamily II)